MLSSARGFDTRNLKNVKTAFEHVSLYVGLIIYTAVGAMVGQFKTSQIYSLHGQDLNNEYLNYGWANALSNSSRQALE